MSEDKKVYVLNEVGIFGALGVPDPTCVELTESQAKEIKDEGKIKKRVTSK